MQLCVRPTAADLTAMARAAATIRSTERVAFCRDIIGEAMASWDARGPAHSPLSIMACAFAAAPTAHDLGLDLTNRDHLNAMEAAVIALTDLARTAEAFPIAAE